MRAAHWTIALFFFAIGGLLLFRLSPRDSRAGEDPVSPDLGALAPLMRPLPQRVERARFVPETGAVVELAAQGDKMVILSSKGWLFQSGESSRGWFGDPTPGSPAWLDRAVSVALGKGEVYILDERRSTVSIWDTLGVRTGEFPISPRTDLVQQTKQIILGSTGDLLLVVLGINMDGDAAWTILAMDSLGGSRTVDSLPSRDESMIFQEPRLALDSLSLLMVETLTQRLSSFDRDSGSFTPRSQRDRPPLWYIPQRNIREYQKILGRMRGTMGSLSALPTVWPSVRDFTVREDGSLLLMVTATEDRIHIEHLSPEAAPIGRFNLDGFDQPVFLSDGRAFIVSEGLEETVIYELVF
jgi:hypothetical protein